MERVVSRDIEACSIFCVVCLEKRGSFDRIVKHWAGGGDNAYNGDSYEPLKETLRGGTIINYNGKIWSEHASKDVLGDLYEKNGLINIKGFYFTHPDKTSIFFHCFICKDCLAQGKKFYMPKICSKIESHMRNKLNRFDIEIESVKKGMKKYAANCACGQHSNYKKEIQKIEKDKDCWLKLMKNLYKY